MQNIKNQKMKRKLAKYKPGGYQLRVGRSSAGLGLFALEEIPKGVCLIEYFGRTISSAEEYTSRSKYLFEINSRRTIDGQTRANRARYANHSCRPNAEAKIYRGRVFLMSRRKIKTGEEITYDYGKTYWREHIAPKGCRCVKCVPSQLKAKTVL
ncbi:MAG: SET domain-containing protein-lysine N-methyltransferase [Candidatus Vogelbacteria bacterium CG10_big_fil_rev_8_21_14_0_10_49_38]|uniref:SET domain-containing protein-lysine N-methyltransferase n=1 Tax=Candidatus Vogelbacteria bacterium CG10_big_fil_rev_8_21_14_0_10_49_38 TaxID=1975043 RepID=A0A2H0RJP9_9BACT|nr:MAG: SET domain-containing protein-lysine N-methyltransferase [Candidatus Vogelbacteria bacterium CG10_big_fil_rev_8_21_14_0_10_49_38]